MPSPSDIERTDAEDRLHHLRQTLVQDKLVGHGRSDAPRWPNHRPWELNQKAQEEYVESLNEGYGEQEIYIPVRGPLHPEPGDPGAAYALPTDSGARKDLPIARGVLDYFPNALAEVAHLSLLGNQKHNPGEEMHHARGKSSDHADCIVRHLMERGTVDPEDGVRHSVKVAWRALALLQEELEREEGLPMARGARHG